MKFPTLMSVLLAVAGAAHAQSVVPPLDQDSRKGEMARLAHKQAVDKFDKADANKDGKLSPEETAKAMPYMADNFGRYDKDKDGFLNWQEYVGHNRWEKN